jgi:hypothetical protein
MQSPAKFIAREILISSVNIRKLGYLITLQSLTNVLKSRGPKTDSCGIPDKTLKGNEKVSKMIAKAD